MTTPEESHDQPLTRRQLREIRNTASTPIITPEDLKAADAAASARAREAAESADVDVSPTPAESVELASSGQEGAAERPGVDDEQPAPVPAVPAVPLARAAEPLQVAPAPEPDANVDLGVNPLTRRQARQQERIRTASVPVITTDLMNAHAAHAEAALDTDLEAANAAPDGAERDAQAEASVIAASADEAADHGEEHEDGPRNEPDAVLSDRDGDEDDADAPASGPILNPAFGAELLAGDGPAPIAAVTLPPSFDQLIARGSTSAGSQSNALILSQTPEGAMMSPVTATGEVLITGTFALPEGLGSQGHAPGMADGKDVDAVLIDGELPAHSSPTPIAASAAISTVKTTGEIIRPPAPEKGGRLMLALAITAGALALALVGVLILAFVTGAL